MFVFRFLGASVLAAGLAGCGSNESSIYSRAVPKHINNNTKFSEAAYGVAASPRVTTSLKVRKGGGRRQIGKPYKIKGKWYTPKEDFDYDRKGQASWYGPNFHGRLTANGEVYDQFALSAAHPTFPLPSYARVTNSANGRSVVVRVNDRGPYHEGRIIDLSARASELLNYQHKGVANVRVQYIKQAPLHGKDHRFLIASYRSNANEGDYAQTKMAVDPTLTGSIKKPSEKANSSPIGDPFIQDLEATLKRKDTGTTVSLRLRRQFILDSRFR